MEDKLKELKDRLKELKLITTKSFETSTELNEYVEKNIHFYEESRSVQEEIEHIEFELMSPKERANYREYQRLSKLKAEGRFPL
jgi:hypothetical protein